MTLTVQPLVNDTGYAHRLHPDYQHLVAATANRPSLRLDLLLDLVAWAEHDDANLAKFQTWGWWHQGSWAGLTVNNLLMDTPMPRGWSDPAAEYREADQTDEEIRQEILRGTCGTSYCMAGQAAHQAGYRMIYNAASRDGRDGVLTAGADQCILTEPTGDLDAKGFPVMRDVGDPIAVPRVAMGILGLDLEEGTLLFAGDNTLRTVKRVVNRICHERALPLPYPDFGMWDDGDGEDGGADDDSDDDFDF